MSSWIKVDDRLPEMTYDVFWWVSDWVLTYGAEGPQIARLRRLWAAEHHGTPFDPEHVSRPEAHAA